MQIKLYLRIRIYLRMIIYTKKRESIILNHISTLSLFPMHLLNLRVMNEIISAIFCHGTCWKAILESLEIAQVGMASPEPQFK